MTKRPLPRNPQPAFLAAVACLCSMLMSACAGLVSAPRYTDAPQAEVVRELAARRWADRKRLLRVANSYRGVPYLWGGTTRAGMDCSALARAIFRETYGIELPRTVRQMYALGQSIQSDKALRAGDLVFFRDTFSGPGVSHVGVYLGDGVFAHASATLGGTLTPLSDAYFACRFAGGRRIRR